MSRDAHDKGYRAGRADRLRGNLLSLSSIEIARESDAYSFLRGYRLGWLDIP